MPTIGQAIVTSDFVSLKAQIALEATRRAITNPNPTTVTVGQPVTAVIFNNYRAALVTLNTKGTITIPASVSASTVIYAWQTQALIPALASLQAETLVCTFPTSIYWTGPLWNGGTSSLWATSNPNGTVTITHMYEYFSYCPSAYNWYGSTIVTPYVVTNSEGKQAYRFSGSITWNRGCCHGNNNDQHTTITVTSRCDGNVEGYSTGYTGGQWGC